MSTSSSNIIQRRNAMWRASLLVLIVMLLTGFGVSRIPQTTGYDLLFANAANQAKLDSFEVLKNHRVKLLAVLEELDATYAEIIRQDSIWESTTTLDSKGKVETQIEALQTRMTNTLGKEGASDRIDTISRNAFANLIIARKGIWKLRTEFSKLNTVNPSTSFMDAANHNEADLDAIKETARIAEETIRAQVIALRGLEIKGIFSNKKEASKLIEDVVEELNNVKFKLQNLR